MNNQLKEGVAILYDMELNNFLMNKAINRLNEEINAYAIPRKVYKPQKREESLFGNMGSGLILGAVIACIIGALIGTIYGFIEEDGFFLRLVNAFATLLVFGFFGAIGGAIVGLIIGIAYTFIKKSQHEIKYAEAMIVYEEDLQREKNRMRIENERKKNLINLNTKIYRKLQESIQKLQEYYHILGIDEKFRNIICIGYINEYFRLSITDKLTGVDGAYNLLMRDLKFERIFAMLEKISYQLDEVIDRQHRLYDELSDMNNKCDRMISATLVSLKQGQQIANNVGLMAYHTERTQKELEFQNFMLICS